MGLWPVFLDPNSQPFLKERLRGSITIPIGHAKGCSRITYRANNLEDLSEQRY